MIYIYIYIALSFLPQVGESIVAAAHRELVEEAGITTPHMTHVGILHFRFDDNPQPWKVFLFRADEGFQGHPTESDEMAPAWFSVTRDLPELYDKMWADDRYWYPFFLENKCFVGVFDFENTHTMVRHEVREVDGFGKDDDPTQVRPA